jgi:hypothetical protein
MEKEEKRNEKEKGDGGRDTITLHRGCAMKAMSISIDLPNIF